MKETLTTIYSQPSIKEFENLIETFCYTLGIHDKQVSDMFYYDVFCAASTYANYDWVGLVMNGQKFDIPYNLYAPCSTPNDRIEYVETIIDDILQKKISKPEWMTYIEMESECDCCRVQPSTFLRLLPKDKKYEALGESLISYLYSPNRVTVVY